MTIEDILVQEVIEGEPIPLGPAFTRTNKALYLKYTYHKNGILNRITFRVPHDGSEITAHESDNSDE